MITAEATLHEITTHKVYEPMTREDAQGLANVWYGMGNDNGFTSGDLDAAAGMPLEEYILRTFGESAQEPEVGGVPTPNY